MSVQLENMVPEYYVNRSRDFQLLCRTLNVFLGASEEQSRKIVNNWDIDTLDESLLPLMARKLGFLGNDYTPPKILRNICKAWPRILRYKGTLQAVREAAYAVFSAYQEIYSLEVAKKEGDSSTIVIISSASQGDEYYLDLILPYIVPAGMAWEYILGLVRKTAVQTSYSPKNEIYRIRGVGGTISRVMGGVPNGLGAVDKSGMKWSESLPNPKDPKGTSYPPHPYSRVGFAQITNSINNVGTVYRDKTITDRGSDVTG